MSGFKAFDAAPSILVGIELMHMLRKGQLQAGSNRASPWPNSSTLWLRNPPPGQEYSPQSIYRRKLATEPDESVHWRSFAKVGHNYIIPLFPIHIQAQTVMGLS
jgi:hypothetical protein